MTTTLIYVSPLNLIQIDRLRSFLNTDAYFGDEKAPSFVKTSFVPAAYVFPASFSFFNEEFHVFFRVTLLPLELILDCCNLECYTFRETVSVDLDLVVLSVLRERKMKNALVLIF